jgi:trk system potassium uptake protein TrkH
VRGPASGPWTVRHTLLVAAGLIALLSLLLEHGTYLDGGGWRLVSWLSGVAVGLFLLELGWAAVAVRPRRLFLRQRWPALALAFLLLGELAVVQLGWGGWLARFLARFSIRSLTQAYLAVVQFYLLGNLLVFLPTVYSRVARWRMRPGLLFLLGFFILILAGACLLSLPKATPPDHPLAAVDAIFTSTSAVCVTGLIVRDTATEFTLFGQVVILLLIQMGGLGIMSLTATFAWLLGRGIGIRENYLLRDIFQVGNLADVGRTLKFIIWLTLCVETAGTIVLYVGFSDAIPEPLPRLFTAAFHAISAFCNAGFSTFSRSLVDFGGEPVVSGTVAALIVAGGLGFTVVANLLAFLQGRLRRQKPGLRPRLELQTRVVIGMTVLLLLVGTGLLGLLDWDGALAGMPPLEKLWSAFFQSVTARTAGFNTLDIASLSSPSLFLLVILMFIGAGPGSTAGGVKLTTVAVMWANLVAIGQGRAQTRLGDREIGLEAVRRAMVVLSGGIVFGALGIILLLVTERREFLTTVFEVVSAQGTVGLSMGLTGELTVPGRVIVTVMMFLGRLGPLTFAFGLVPPAQDRNIRLPSSKIMIG